jgi:hypothetical protein
MDEAIGIITFEQIRSGINVASSRIRAHWLLKHWRDAELFTISRKYSVVIFQKAYWTEYALLFPGLKILDVCDPDFLSWNSKCIKMANLCDAIVTSTEQLAAFIARYTNKPVVCVPDRLDLATFSESSRKRHECKGDAKIAVWSGYSRNFAALDAALPDLLRLGYNRLIAISDPSEPYRPPPHLLGNLELVTHVWNPTTANEQIKEADVVINYGLDYGRWKYKSNNKTVLAWALGLPVAHSARDLATWVSEEARIKESADRWDEIVRDYDVNLSINQYKALISSLRRGGL